MKYCILGPLAVTDHGRSVAPTAPKTASVLATLLTRANDFVSTETLMEEIWGEVAPASAGTTLQTYIYQIRCALGRATIETRVGGYVLPVQDGELDLLRFRALVCDGRDHLEQGRPDQASVDFRAGLALWRGRPLSNVRIGHVLQPYLAHLEEERRQVAELCVQAAFAAGRHREVIGEIRLLIADDPYNEWLHARLIEALSRSGRRREALLAYESLRKLLADNLGLDPMLELRELELQVLQC